MVNGMTIPVFFTGADSDEAWPLIRDHHYSGRMPTNIQHIYAIRGGGGLFGDCGDVIAAAIFVLAQAKWAEPVLELGRLVRHPGRECPPLSRLVGFASKRLRLAKWNLVISYADRTQGHHGGIYQACGWQYSGCRDPSIDGVVVNGKFIPGRSCNARWGTRSPDKLREILNGRSVEPHYDEGKHLYWLALHNSGARKAAKLGLQSIPYPKPNAVCSMDDGVPTPLSEAQPLETAPTQEAML
jgi:hypothetical protein